MGSLSVFILIDFCVPISFLLFFSLYSVAIIERINIKSRLYEFMRFMLVDVALELVERAWFFFIIVSSFSWLFWRFIKTETWDYVL